MPLTKWWDLSRPVPGAPHSRGLTLTLEQWIPCATDVAAAAGRLLAMWVSDGAVHAALLAHRGLLLIELPRGNDGLAASGPMDTYPGLQKLFPCASRMQRAAFDLSGVHASDPDRRPWLRHAPEGYDFVRVAGDGVHEIAVGPVHAGTIEPGHFRFSVVGEKVLKLEERLGYTHKGIEQRFTQLPILQGHHLAARIAGDSTIAWSWAYCQALEGMAACPIPPRAAHLRALMLELERIANHLGDLGALANDAGFAFGLSQFSRLKEELLRTLGRTFGQRYLLDAISPGGTRVDINAESASQLALRMASIRHEAAELRAIYDDHAGVRDRFVGTGILEPELAARLGVLGLVARASGQALDARTDLPCPPYDALAPAKVVRQEGDVAARVAVRFDELEESCQLALRLLDSLPGGAHATEVRTPADDAFGVGLIESWRGPVLIAIEAGHDGAIRRCHAHDPSWQNWPALEHAILGNIVADFPLINKSFNLVYCGVDL
jgi:Ni,Fe-hydrogenase III large subunit